MPTVVTINEMITWPEFKGRSKKIVWDWLRTQSIPAHKTPAGNAYDVDLVRKALAANPPKTKHQMANTAEPLGRLELACEIKRRLLPLADHPCFGDAMDLATTDLREEAAS